MGVLWLVVTVGGPILLAAALAYATIRNWQETQPGDEERSERSTKARDQLYREDEQRERQETHI